MGIIIDHNVLQVTKLTLFRALLCSGVIAFYLRRVSVRPPIRMFQLGSYWTGF
jgi:hypothetical protein